MSAKQGASGIDLDAAIDELYQAPLDRFTAQRNELAAALRKAGDRVHADDVKALVKPAVTAWAVNQAWWQEQAAFREMLDAGAALRSAHVARARGKSADIRGAAETRQRAVNAVIEAAVMALGGPAAVAPDARHRIAGTVEALASGGSPAGPGRWSKDLQASGLEALSALAGLSSAAAPPAAPTRPVLVARRDAAKAPESPAKARAEAKAEAAARLRTQQLAEAKTRLADRETALRAATLDADAANASEQKARAALETATAKVAELESALDAAREADRYARRALAQASKTASEAEMIHARTARDVNAARVQVESKLEPDERKTN